MKDLEQKYFKNAQSFRTWLEDHVDSSPGIWMIFYKKHTNTPCISYREALDEALCFDWIDSILKRINDEKYMQKFSPRKNISNWSDVNKKKVMALIDRGKMTERGLQKIDLYLKTGKLDWTITEKKKEKKPPVIPDFILKELSRHEPALARFHDLAPSYRRNYTLWIMDAKKEETRYRRLNEVIDVLKKNVKLGMK